MAAHEGESRFRAVFDEYEGQVVRFFLRKGLSREDALDLTQDVFFSVYRNMGSVEDPSRMAGWVFTIARNTYLNDVERRHAAKRSGIHVAPLEELAAGEDGALEALLAREDLERLAAALQTLPAQMRRCVELRAGEGAAYDEIATVMGVSINTVKAHLHKARKALAERLGGER